MKKEKWAIITLSQDGVVLSQRLKNYLDDKICHIYTKKKYATEDMKPIQTDITTFMGNIMGDYDIICCIMATGIVIRAIAPHLGHKSTDPGILVMDANGENVISLLSGHLGGANDAARLIEKRIHAKAIITTGTDVKGTLAVDVLAEKLGCAIQNFTDAKDITALILNGEPVALINQEQCNLSEIILPGNIEIIDDANHIESYAGVIIISVSTPKIVLNKPLVQLIPKKTIIGIGCRRNKVGVDIIHAVNETLNALNLSNQSIKAFATIGLKENEPGIIETCDYFKAKKIIVPDEMIQMVQSRFESSEFVFKTTGLYAVSEPCGYIVSGFGKCLLEKQKINGITISLWLEDETK